MFSVYYYQLRKLKFICVITLWSLAFVDVVFAIKTEDFNKKVCYVGWGDNGETLYKLKPPIELGILNPDLFKEGFVCSYTLNDYGILYFTSGDFFPYNFDEFTIQLSKKGKSFAYLPVDNKKMMVNHSGNRYSINNDTQAIAERIDGEAQHSCLQEPIADYHINNSKSELLDASPRYWKMVEIVSSNIRAHASIMN